MHAGSRKEHFSPVSWISHQSFKSLKFKTHMHKGHSEGSVIQIFDYDHVFLRVYGQFCIETLHESRKRKSSGLFVRISTFR